MKKYFIKILKFQTYFLYLGFFAAANKFNNDISH